MIVASLADITIISGLALGGVAMHSIPAAVLAGVIVAALLFGFALDFVKVPVFRRLGIS